MTKIRINSKHAFITSALYSLIFVIFSIYKGILLLLVQSAMEDTFVGGKTSNISITLWFFIAGVMGFITFIFIYLLKVKDLKSQKTILSGVSISWILISIIQLVLFKNYFYLAILTLIPIVINYIAIKNLKIDIIKKLNEKGLTEKEIHLLQLLAGTKKK